MEFIVRGFITEGRRRTSHTEARYWTTEEHRPRQKMFSSLSLPRDGDYIEITAAEKDFSAKVHGVIHNLRLPDTPPIVLIDLGSFTSFPKDKELWEAVDQDETWTEGPKTEKFLLY